MALIKCDHAANGPYGLSWPSPGSTCTVDEESTGLDTRKLHRFIAELCRIAGFSELQPGGSFAEVAVPAPATEAPSLPPKVGPGASAAAWRAYATANGVEIEDEARRDDIIAALEAAGIATE